MKSLKKDNGFTLLESLLVLLCMSVFLTVPLITIKSWKSHLAIEQFFNQLERNIQLTHQSAIVEGQIARIDTKNEGKLKFEYFYRGKKRIDELKVVEGVVLRSSENIVFNSTTGNIKKIEGIRFEDHVNKQWVLYSFQLGSGKVIRSVKKW